MANGIFTESPCEGAPFNQSGAFPGIPLFDFDPAVAKALQLAAAILAPEAVPLLSINLAANRAQLAGLLFEFIERFVLKGGSRRRQLHQDFFGIVADLVFGALFLQAWLWPQARPALARLARLPLREVPWLGRLQPATRFYSGELLPIRRQR